MSTTIQEQLVKYIADAHALEQHVNAVLASALKMTDVPELVVINKIDLLPYVDFDMDRFLGHLEAVHPGVETIRCSARTGEGTDAWREWLGARVTRTQVAA